MRPRLCCRQGSVGLVLIAVLAAHGQSPAGTPPPSETIHMEPYEVVEPKVSVTIEQKLQDMDHRFDGPFAELRSGPMIEAILWRHRYLSEHPSDKAIILTTGTGVTIKSATTVYTQNGGIYLSSNAMGEHRKVDGLAAAAIDDPRSVEKIRAVILRERESYLPGGDPARSDFAVATDSDSNVDLNGGPPVLGKLLVIAEETNDYTVLAMQAGGKKSASQARMAAALLQTFAQPSSEVLSWTYRVLHDPARAGLVPVALSDVDVQEDSGKTVTIQALAFDWDGTQYIYEPDRGTQGLPIPRNPVTGLPYLCVRNGGLMECAYFCSTYLRAHPGEKVMLLPGEPTAVAFTEKGSIGIFGLALGPFVTKPIPPGVMAQVLAHPASLVGMRDKLARGVRQKIPEKMLGDNTDMQMRRAFLALQEAGIPAHLRSGLNPYLRFTWVGADFVYGEDQTIRQAKGG